MRAWGLVLWLFPVAVFGRDLTLPASSPEGKLTYYVNLYSSVGTSSKGSSDLAVFVNRLEQKQSSFKHRKDFLEFIFHKTHQKFLKNFSEYASFPETLEKGNYNCLTGTALYALLLEHFEIPYQIVETNYHIFLLAETDKGSILFETTDPADGFVTDAEEIKNRIARYRQNSIQTARSSKTYYRYNFDLYKTVTLDEVSGLLYYNLSIVAFNAKDLSLAIDHLGKAMELYRSPRIEEFSRIILLTVMEGNLDPFEKERCLENIRSLRDKHLFITASR
ncbi:MAG TPA: hypothetical protein VF141_07100 [Chryseolinea sp.]